MPLTAGQTTLGAMRAEVRERTDNTNNPFFDDTKLNGWISSARKELVDLLTEKMGEDYYFSAPFTFTCDGTNDFYALPTDMYNLLTVDAQLSSGGRWITVHRFNRGERNRNNYPLAPVLTPAASAPFKYRLAGSQVWFDYAPDNGTQIRLFYVPRPAELTLDTDVLDGISGWEELVTLEVCIRMCAKEETDPSVFIAQKTAMVKRIEDAAANRDSNEPETVTDVYREMYGIWDPWNRGL